MTDRERLNDIYRKLSKGNRMNLLKDGNLMLVAQGNPPESVRVEKSVEDKREGREKARV